MFKLLVNASALLAAGACAVPPKSIQDPAAPERSIQQAGNAMTATSSEAPMFKSIAYVYQSVSDLAKSCEFFEQKLGFKLHTNQDYVKGLAMGPGYLVIRRDEPGFKASSRGAGANVCVLVENVDRYRATLVQRGVAVGEIHDQPWGQRDFYLTDPDGYSWCFAQATQ